MLGDPISSIFSNWTYPYIHSNAHLDSMTVFHSITYECDGPGCTEGGYLSARDFVGQYDVRSMMNAFRILTRVKGWNEINYKWHCPKCSKEALK